LALNVYSTHFWSALGHVGSHDIPGTPGYLMILRDVDVYNGAGGNASFFLQGGLGQAIWAALWGLGDGRSSKQWTGRQVIDYPYGASVTSDVPMDITVSGYLLKLP
jgi:hypothetical protein